MASYLNLENLKWLGIDYDESIDIGGPYAPYRQMERLDIYKKHAEEMLEKGHAYKCFCSSEELEAEREVQKEKGVAAPMYNGKCRHLSAEEVASKRSSRTSIHYSYACTGKRNYTL